MSTTPTLRDAAQAVLDALDECRFDIAANEALRAALTRGAGAVEPVAHLWRNVIDGRPRVVMPDSIITADASWVVEDSLHTATQLQQTVARAVERCAAICDDLADRACAAQEGPTDDTTNVMLRQVATLGARECAALIRAKGTHD